MSLRIHPRHDRSHIHEPETIGEKAADAVVAGMGSWRFILIQAAIVVCWIAANAVLLTQHPFDPPPFILLNLAFSTQASFAAPLLQLSNNRQATKDRKRDELEAREVHLLYRINKQQVALLVALPVATAIVVAVVTRRRRIAP